MSKKLSRNQEGYTIVELLIATAIFSVVLLLCAAAIVHVGRMYYKGVITTRTQETSRKIVDDVAQSIQFGPGSEDPAAFVRLVSAGGLNAYCIGSIRYTFNSGQSLGSAPGQTPHVLWKDRISDGVCQPVAFAAGAEELLGENMRLPQFVITPSGNLWNISVRVTYGDSPQLYESPSFEFCKGSSAGGQFCAVSAFNTNVVERL